MRKTWYCIISNRKNWARPWLWILAEKKCKLPKSTYLTNAEYGNRTDHVALPLTDDKNNYGISVFKLYKTLLEKLKSTYNYNRVRKEMKEWKYIITIINKIQELLSKEIN